MRKIIELTHADIVDLISTLNFHEKHDFGGVHKLRFTIEGDTVKFKVNERIWSPPLGHLDPECREAQDRAYETDFVARQYADFAESEEKRTGLSFKGQQLVEEERTYPFCSICGDPVDYCQGHGETVQDINFCPCCGALLGNKPNVPNQEYKESWAATYAETRFEGE